MIQCPPEKLGSFYLGGKYDISKKELTGEAVNYDSRDLTTHAVCVGMTGSGKTGLCIGLLEEAAMDKVPAIVIDPKGDMTNLLLQFGNLEPNSFKQWINPDDASRKGMSVEDYAASTAEKWKNGLADWGQDTHRIKTLKDSVEYTIYTPGSDAGIPINIMGSFAAPNINFEDDAEMLTERIQGTVAALLGMIGSKEDPSRSREGILLATLFEHYWRLGEDLDLAKLINGIQKPPFAQLGVFDVDTFYPQKDRFKMAMDFNSLVASPKFKYWLQGDPLDIETIYFTPEGKPRHSIFYIAHLSESERMFFVTLLLNSLITWMRSKSGTSSLRSLLYFDEIFGYFPPTQNPPSKKPLLTILKQARAYGVGAVLVTQNPVDIDYKGLSNAGTWFIGKLQTERDKMRVLDGLKGAIAEAGSNASLHFDSLISSLDSRVFLYHNVHQDEPVVYHTRWVMSYLRGPLTRPQVKTLMAEAKESRKVKTVKESSQSGGRSVQETSAVIDVKNVAPSLDPKIEQRYFGVWKSASEAEQDLGSRNPTLRYDPLVLSIGKVRFFNAKRGVDKIKDVSYLSLGPDDFGRIDWEHSVGIDDWQSKLIEAADHPDNLSVSYSAVPDSMDSLKEVGAISKEFANWLYQNEKTILYEHPKLKIFQENGESAAAFQMRVQQLAREYRDEELDKIQDKFEDKLERIEDKIRKEQFDLDQAKSEVRSRRTSEVVGVAETIFSVLIRGRSKSISSTTTKTRMRKKAAQKLEESKSDLMNLAEDREILEQDLSEALTEVRTKWEIISEGVVKKEINPRKTDVKVDEIILVWHPYWVDDKGNKVAARR